VNRQEADIELEQLTAAYFRARRAYDAAFRRDPNSSEVASLRERRKQALDAADELRGRIEAKEFDRGV
jgi:hypothetical protein